jgi:Domain of unknown function (DUF5753)
MANMRNELISSLDPALQQYVDEEPMGWPSKAHLLLAGAEQDSTRIDVFSDNGLHGLFQTEAVRGRIIGATLLPSEIVAQRAGFRAELRKAALRKPLGGIVTQHTLRALQSLPADIAEEQLGLLHELAEPWSIRVVGDRTANEILWDNGLPTPDDTGQQAFSFTIPTTKNGQTVYTNRYRLDKPLAEPGVRIVAEQEAIWPSGGNHDQPDPREPYLTAYAQLSEAALSVEATRQHIGKLRQGFVT